MYHTTAGGDMSERALESVPAAEAADGEITCMALFAADYVAAESGKLYVSGGFFSVINFPSFPAVHSSLGIGIVLRVPFREYQRDHHFTVILTDADNNPLDLRVEGQFRVGADPQMRFGDPTIMPMAVNASGVRFERAGDYKLAVTVDGNPKGTWNLQARQMLIVPPQPPPG
jgi:hypothetical protein